MKKTCRLLELERTAYEYAWDFQKEMVQQRRSGQIDDTFIMLEHDHVYTIGRAGSRNNILVAADQLKAEGVTVVEVDRGGDVTYHGPGQLVGYPILNLTAYGKDMHLYVRMLEEVIIRTIAVYGINGHRENGLTGVWTEKGKIAAIGVGVKGWVSMHGFSLNIHPDMRYFSMINPCGITNRPVTSMRDFAVSVSRNEVSHELLKQFADVFDVQITPARSKEDGCNTA